jgi:hypothetical protein
MGPGTARQGRSRGGRRATTHNFRLQTQPQRSPNRNSEANFSSLLVLQGDKRAGATKPALGEPSDQPGSDGGADAGGRGRLKAPPPVSGLPRGTAVGWDPGSL